MLIVSARSDPDLKLDVQILPPGCDDPAFVQSLNDKPGILALAMEKKNGKLEALPFIVPGARFNEKYGWDSVSSISSCVRSPAVLYGSRPLGGRQNGSRQEYRGALYLRDQTLQQGPQRQPVLRKSCMLGFSLTSSIWHGHNHLSSPTLHSRSTTSSIASRKKSTRTG